MIDIVLADHRTDDDPVVAVAQLPGKFGALDCDVTARLVLWDERPVIETRMKTTQHGWNQDFYFTLKAAQFSRWLDLVALLTQGRPGEDVLPAVSISSRQIDIHAWLRTYPTELRLYAQPNRYLVVEKGDFPVWAHDLQWLLELGLAIHDHVERDRRQRRSDLLDHVETLLVYRKLSN